MVEHERVPKGLFWAAGPGSKTEKRNFPELGVQKPKGKVTTLSEANKEKHKQPYGASVRSNPSWVFAQDLPL